MDRSKNQGKNMRSKKLYQHWSNSDEKKLISLYVSGMEVIEIAKRFPERTYKGVSEKILSLSRSNKVELRRPNISILTIQKILSLKGISYQEIAQKTRLKIETVKSIIWRTKK